jgi:hypothetical protein
MTRWQVRLATSVVAVVLTLALPLLGKELPTVAFSQSAPFSGELFYLRGGDVWQLDLTTNEQRLFLHSPAGQVTHLIPAPDGRRIAYAIDVADPANRLQSSELYVADRDGANARVVVREVGEGYRVGWVSWPSDPSKLVYSKENPARRVERVEEVDLTSG